MMSGKAYGNQDHGFVFIVKDLVKHSLCNELADAMDTVSHKRIQGIKQTSNLPTHLQVIHTIMLPIIKQYYPQLNTQGMELMKHYTVSRHYKGDEIGWHFDKKKNTERFKVCVYLSNNSGTYFAVHGTRNKYIHVRPSKGDVVIFDMNLEHRGAPIVKGVKKVLGLRLGATCDPLSESSLCR
jgi:hypothetical protein